MSSLGYRRLLVTARQYILARSYASQNFQTYEPVNEPLLDYAPGSSERKEVEEALKRYNQQVADIPIVIGDEEIRSGPELFQVSPHDHNHKVAKYRYATKDIIKKGIDSCLKARKQWERTPIEKRADIFLKAADMMAKERRMDLVATTMIGQSKNVWQAEIDAAAELIDFLRFNVAFARQMTQYQPLSPDSNITNRSVYRGLEGFWAAITPFNFTAIGGHLPAAPALMGNVSLWKPSDTAMLSNYEVFKIYREAGLPAGVINFVPADGPVFGDTIVSSPDLAGVNFTGSVKTFKYLWKQIANNIDTYKSYPRIIGECGGKNLHFVHPSADVESVVNGTIRGAFEFNGQKCSATSRMYVPESLWPDIRDGFINIHKEIKMGSPLEKDSFVTAVIDDKSFNRVEEYVNHAKNNPNNKIIAGGNCNNSKGYFIEPTIIETKDPKDRLMQEEIFGPVLTVYVYPDNKCIETAELANQTSPFALTAAIFAKDEGAQKELVELFRDNAGNFYINDKSTGSVVGQQPFGGTRLSGTNEKSGGPHYLMKFVSVQSVKENKAPLREWRYPSMQL
ncbi:delta-1-pyrroline-5-carboxylate dehydrogenase, mitochondrial [Patella vulgata]|uniref:delta-1-pyrroline-5-carboxylate dehydrogenase, mitochondrial n=1 Tax=Patella vulgata TaxID=6465 RepID=UPI00217FC038|nr:delta-1-pyrroline-5-carboxylate dehydrogenase, mitochondrial [Patella vulgata]